MDLTVLSYIILTLHATSSITYTVYNVYKERKTTLSGFSFSREQYDFMK